MISNEELRYCAEKLAEWNREILSNGNTRFSEQLHSQQSEHLTMCMPRPLNIREKQS